MSKKFVPKKFILNKSNLIFFLCMCVLVISTLYYNINFSKVKIILSYKISLLPETYNSFKFLRDKPSIIKYTFYKLYNSKKKLTDIDFQKIEISNNYIAIVSTKEFNNKDEDSVKDYTKNYNKFAKSLANNLEREYVSHIVSNFEKEYNYLLFLNFYEDKNVFDPNKKILFSDFHNNIILFKQSENFQDYINLKNINIDIEYENKVSEIKKVISYIDLLIFVISLCIVYFSILFFFKKT